MHRSNLLNSNLVLCCHFKARLLQRIVSLKNLLISQMNFFDRRKINTYFMIVEPQTNALNPVMCTVCCMKGNICCGHRYVLLFLVKWYTTHGRLTAPNHTHLYVCSLHPYSSIDIWCAVSDSCWHFRDRNYEIEPTGLGG